MCDETKKKRNRKLRAVRRLGREWHVVSHCADALARRPLSLGREARSGLSGNPG